MNLIQVLVYLDDLIVFGRTLEEHKEWLLKVLDRLEECGLKVSIDKCQFCQPQVKFLGHIVSTSGVATDPEKVSAVTHWKKPTDLKSLRSFLGFCGYYRRFIENYSAIVRPLTELTKGYSQAFPTKDQKALTVTKVLFEKFFVHYGLPARIHSDQGRDFESKLIKELLTLLGIRKSRTSPYHPQGDPQPERFNRTLLAMLGTLDPAKKPKWSQHISQLVHAYKTTRNDAKGYSPYFLMFGREARLPIDLCFGVGSDEENDLKHHQYVANMRKELQKAYQLAADAASRNNERNKRLYDARVRNQTLEEGDRVLVRNLGLTGKHKLQDRWNSLPYIVIAKLPNLPVYRVKPERGTGIVRTIGITCCPLVTWSGCLLHQKRQRDQRNQGPGHSK